MVLNRKKNKNDMEENKGQILLYQTPDGESRIEVKLEGELNREVVVAKIRWTAAGVYQGHCQV